DIILEDNENSNYIDGIKLKEANMVIDGNGHKIDACGKTRIFEVFGKNITLKNINLKNGYSEKSGGAISIEDGGILKIHNCSIFDNESNYGGAIYCGIDVNLDIDCTNFSRNISHSAGGVIVGGSNSVLDINDSTFSENKSLGDSGNVGGGSIDWHENSNITNCIFSNNFSKYPGGAISSYDSKIYKCLFESNASDESGGALIISKGELNDCIFKQNVAKEKGGAIYQEYSNSYIINNCTFENNSAKTADEMYVTGNITMSNSIISNNVKNERNENNFLIFNENFLKVLDCRFLNSNSNYVIINEDTLEIYNSIFSENAADDMIYNTNNDCTLNVFYGNFNSNHVEKSLIFNEGKVCTLNGTTFENNIFVNENSKDIVNMSKLNLTKIKMNDKGKCIFNDGEIFIKNSPPTLNNQIVGAGIVNWNISRQNENYDFTFLDEEIHKNTKEYVLKQDISLAEYEIDFYEGGIELDIDDFVINGNGHNIDGGGLSRIFIITAKNITLKNIVFKNGYSHNYYNNILNSSGGALRILSMSNILIENCEFIDNISEKMGGAIFNEGEGVLKDSTFTNNYAKGKSFQDGGGAIYDDSNLIIEDCIFSKNKADGKMGQTMAVLNYDNIKENSFKEKNTDNIVVRAHAKVKFEDILG
ncbi:right-handed parallel beta-helix repeat-containing protein, partial [Methanobrevibacter sp.]|uniref:right-handed parallel beta-helix repeat-containing protein n=1 Tax=Methanobrevibacter sp. TaxID=66852 RepID=UPI00389112D1